MLFKSNKKSNKEERESKKKEREREVKDEIKTKGKGDKTKNWEDTAKGKVEEVSEREEITSKVLPVASSFSYTSSTIREVSKI